MEWNGPLTFNGMTRFAPASFKAAKLQSTSLCNPFVIAADTYIRLFQIDEPVRFDIITVIGKTGNFRIEHIKEAFYPPLF